MNRSAGNKDVQAGVWVGEIAGWLTSHRGRLFSRSMEQQMCVDRGRHSESLPRGRRRIACLASSRTLR